MVPGLALGFKAVVLLAMSLGAEGVGRGRAPGTVQTTHAVNDPHAVPPTATIFPVFMNLLAKEMGHVVVSGRWDEEQQLDCQLLAGAAISGQAHSPVSIKVYFPRNLNSEGFGYYQDALRQTPAAFGGVLCLPDGFGRAFMSEAQSNPAASLEIVHSRVGIDERHFRKSLDERMVSFIDARQLPVDGYRTPPGPYSAKHHEALAAAIGSKPWALVIGAELWDPQESGEPASPAVGRATRLSQYLIEQGLHILEFDHGVNVVLKADEMAWKTIFSTNDHYPRSIVIHGEQPERATVFIDARGDHLGGLQRLEDKLIEMGVTEEHKMPITFVSSDGDAQFDYAKANPSRGTSYAGVGVAGLAAAAVVVAPKLRKLWKARQARQALAHVIKAAQRANNTHFPQPPDMDDFDRLLTQMEEGRLKPAKSKFAQTPGQTPEPVVQTLAQALLDEAESARKLEADNARRGRHEASRARKEQALQQPQPAEAGPLAGQGDSKEQEGSASTTGSAAAKETSPVSEAGEASEPAARAGRWKERSNFHNAAEICIHVYNAGCDVVNRKGDHVKFRHHGSGAVFEIDARGFKRHKQSKSRETNEFLQACWAWNKANPALTHERLRR